MNAALSPALRERRLQVALAIVLLCGAMPQTATAQVRARADVSCTPAGDPLAYDCTVRLTDARSDAPLSGVSLSIGADMPSMPGVHHLRPAVATEAQPAGTYRTRLVLDMHGDWALQINLSGPVRDRVVKVLRFESDRVEEARPRRGGKGHAN
ncbi:MAG TPA: FixH family protein [Burkholderiaceae bacterium]|jgi:hypothetical protein|nr:FixH family protein [Burkholderiaceae bacterium]